MKPFFIFWNIERRALQYVIISSDIFFLIDFCCLNKNTIQGNWTACIYIHNPTETVTRVHQFYVEIIETHIFLTIILMGLWRKKAHSLAVEHRDSSKYQIVNFMKYEQTFVLKWNLIGLINYWASANVHQL